MMLLDYFGVFGWIFGKKDEISKSGQFQGPTSRLRDPTQWCGREGGLDKPRVRRGVAKLRHGKGLRCNITVLCRGVVLFTNMCFCHVLLFRYFEDLSIGLMRTL